MANSDSGEPRQNAFRDEVHEAFIRNCHELMAMGYARLDHGSLRTAEEAEITGELVDSIREATEAPESPRWVERYECADDPPLSTPGRRGKRRRRVDLAFVRTQHGPRPRFQVEAKRLYCGGSVGAYLGTEGLGRILSGDYAAKHSDAGMLGYVQVDTPAKWATRIEKRLGNSPAQYAVRANGGFCASRVSSLLEHTYRSSHERISVGMPVDVYHTLLAFN